MINEERFFMEEKEKVEKEEMEEIFKYIKESESFCVITKSKK